MTHRTQPHHQRHGQSEGQLRYTALLTTGLSLLLLVGCGQGGGKTHHLAGEVTLNGHALPDDVEASLTFSPADGGESVVVPVVSGKYDSPNTPAGKVTLRFYITSPHGPIRVNSRTGENYRDQIDLVPGQYAGGVPIEVNEDNLDRNYPL